MAVKLRAEHVILARERAHAVFDLLHEQGWMSKSEAYHWLASTLTLPKAEAHIGRMNPEQCEQIFRLSKDKLRGLVRSLRGEKVFLETKLKEGK